MLDVVNQLEWAARFSPNDEFLVTAAGDRSTYTEFDDAVNRAANALATLGVERDDTVGILVGNTAENLRSFLAGMRLGCTVVPLNFRGGTEEIARQIEHDRVDALIVGRDHQDTYRAIEDDISVADVVTEGTDTPAGTVAYRALLEDAPADPRRPVVGRDHVQIIYHTGGTTGVPKSVPWHAGGVESHAKKFALELGLTREDTLLLSTPLFHIASAMMGAFMIPYVGGRIVLLDRFSPEPVIDAIEAEAVTTTLLVPSMMRAILRSDDIDLDAADTSSLERIAFTGEPLDAETEREITTAFPNARIWNVFGATEVGITLGLPPGESREENCVGRPFADRDISIRDADGRRVDGGEYGELWIRGKDTPTGFFRMPDVTATSYGQGETGDWFRTGDAAYIDADGFVHVVGRLDDRITRGGENIQPSEVEAVLIGIDGVDEAAVFAVPHDVLGETVGAAIVAARDVSVTEADVRERCAGRLAGYKHPERIVFRDELPRTDAGKFDRARLRDELVGDA